MVQLSISVFQVNCSVKILMRLIKLTKIQIDVTSVEVIVGIVFIKFDSFDVVSHSFTHLALVIVCKTTVLMIK